MKKLIYVVKRGRNTGIYDEWKKCYEQTNGFSGALYRSFEYKSELENEDENKPGSLLHAFMLAKKYMSDFSIGELRLVYQGKNKNFIEEDSWKKDGFLPFVSSEKSSVHDYDHTKEEETYSMLHIPEHPGQNEPWLEILMYTAKEDSTITGGNYVGRYHVPTLYIALLKFVFDPKPILYDFVQLYGGKIYPKIQDDVSMEISPDDWFDYACKVWEESDECRELRQRFEKNGLEYKEFDELNKRGRAFARKCYDGILDMPYNTYTSMKEYIKQGGHSLSDLYFELTENDIYRNELINVSGPYVNPDLENRLHRDKGKDKASFKQLVMHTEAIGVKLKEKVIGQDDVIDKLERTYFHAEKNACQGNKRKGPRNVFLFAGPSGVGKTFTAQLFADELGLPFRRFDMSGYNRYDHVVELTGSSTLWKDAKAGVLTSYVSKNPNSVLLFDEIEKAHIDVIRLFLQIIDDGMCFDCYYDTNISFKDTIIIFTTNAGRQLYCDAKDENLTVLPDKVVLDALGKDINKLTNEAFFPPEILSRMSSYSVIMFNHLKADALSRVVENDVESQLMETEREFGYNLRTGKSKLAKTVLYSMGGSADARNASKLAGKLIDRELYEFMILMNQKMLSDNIEKLNKIEWDCDFTGVTNEVQKFYYGEKDCVIPVFGEMQYEPSGILKENGITVKNTTDSDAFMEMLHEGRVLFAVIDYALGLENTENSLNIIDERTKGREVFLKTTGKNGDIPVYILFGGKSEYKYSDREKNELLRIGAKGFINSEYYDAELETSYWNVCCQKVMDTLAHRHQVLSYRTRKRLDERCDVGRIEFYDLRLETAVESEDRDSILSDAQRPDIKFSDVIGAEKAKEELRYFVKYLTNPEEFLEKGGRPPKGILLYGNPGTGKTMLARAMAGESDATFIQTSATEFKSKYVGESEANIRRLFERARKYAPSIIFIDEIDAIGKKRTGSEYTHATESMLNALLTEMDGFSGADVKKPIFVLAATNSGVDGNIGEDNSLDEALLRRFDNKVYVDLPNEAEREQYILKLLGDKKITTVSQEVAHNIAERTTGLSLADLQNVFELATRNAIRQSDAMTDDTLLTALEEYNSLPSDVERPNIKFDDVIGAENAKEELGYFMKYLTNPKEFLEKGGRAPKGILLYGEPGTGKTMLAKAMAGESKVTFLQTSAAEFKSRYVGESEANIRRLFEKARKYAPSVIFIDEIDAIGRKRTGSEYTRDTESMLNALLTEMDGFRGTDSNKPVFVLAATNSKARGESDEVGALDEALLRRFDNKIYVNLPNEGERERYILKLLADKKITTVSEESVHNIAQRTTGQSLAQLQNVFELALRGAIRRSEPMTDDDLLTALDEYIYGEKKEHTPDYYKRVAIHEIGHAYMSYISGDKPSYITIESRGNHGGYMSHANQEDVTGYTREELLARIRISLAGRASEEVFYGRKEALNTGASSDLQKATDIAFQIVCTYGMEDDQMIVLRRDEILNSTLAGEYTARVNEMLKTQMKNTIETIENAKARIQKIADALVKENRLTGKQFEELMEADM